MRLLPLPLALTVSLLALSPGLRAQQPPSAPAPAAAAAEEPEEPKPAVREVSPGIFEIGLVKLEQKTRTVTFAAAINMDSGVLEYLLVGRGGPTHESLLVTDARPLELHTAMLLLGAANPTPGKPGTEAPPAQLTAEYLKHAPKLVGTPVLITATWKDKAGAEKTTDVSDWLLFSPTKKVPPRGPWTYTGSLFAADNRFMAQVEDIFAGLVTNPAALINNPRKGSDNDNDWIVNKGVVPPAETPVTLSIKVAEEKKAPAKPER